VDFTDSPATVIKEPEEIYQNCSEALGLVESKSGSEGVWILTVSMDSLPNDPESFELIAIEFNGNGELIKKVSNGIPYLITEKTHAVIQVNENNNLMVIGAHHRLLTATFNPETGSIYDV